MKTRLLHLLVLTALLLAACNLPAAPTTAPSDTPPPPTLPPADTVVPPTDVPTETPTEVPPLYGGFWARRGDTFYAHDFDGVPLGMEIPVPGAPNWLGVGDAQVLGNTAYYYNKDTQQIYTNAIGGSPAPLAFIPAGVSLSFVVSPDGSKIAWAFDDWDTTNNAPFSQMWVANMDGSGARMLAQIAAPGNEQFFVLMPYRWVDDHTFLYTLNITGIGGYILFWGFASLYRIDINTGISTVLVGDNYFISLSEVSPGEGMYFTTGEPSGSSGARVNKIRMMGSTDAIVLPDLPDQGQSGSARFSPSGMWVAYAVARAEMDNERGQVAVVPVDGSAAPLVVADFEGGIFHVAGWMDENTLLIVKTDFTLGYSDNTSIWKVNRDGTGLTMLTTGDFVGFMQP